MKTVEIVLGIALSLGLWIQPVHGVGEEQTVASPDGVKIAYAVEEKGSPALVFVHGWCSDRTYWRYQVPEFANSYTVVTVDLAGHGHSGTNREKWTIEAFGEDVAAVVKKLDLPKVILIGHSMGGEVIIEAAKRTPERVVALVGVDTYQNLEREMDEKVRAQFLAALRADFPQTTKAFLMSMFPPSADSTLVDEILTDIASGPAEIGIAIMENLLNYKTKGALEGLKIPVITINTDRYPTDVEAGKRQAYSFEVKYMKGLGHFVMLEDPKQFNTLLAQAIEEVARR